MSRPSDGIGAFRVTVLLSGKHGRGSNMERLHHACLAGSVPARIVRVVGTHAASPALARARELGLATSVVPTSPPNFPARLFAAIAQDGPDAICLAGYLRIVPQELLAAYPQKILNIHPSLLPAFGGQGMYGRNVHQAVLDYGAKVSGCTVHFVDESYDTGPVILQTAVPVREDDTPEMLAARVLAAEHETYPQALKLLAEGRLRVQGRRVQIDSPHFPKREK